MDGNVLVKRKEGRRPSGKLVGFEGLERLLVSELMAGRKTAQA
jgi:small nuclear ribonucleoprotein (snRNP)-like protein